ncbi:hypothetical protein [Geotalea toluenoxydans]|uniref:hypothetical protein n=1 Tax=Geotalea toluenoxydans TaxID=421624 RepID=UPI000AEFBA22|nr:hypothetical protein [Geotalea toluenoxydans]
MKKSLLVIVIGLAFAALTGCATTGELEKVQAQEQLTGAKADQPFEMHKLPRRQPMPPSCRPMLLQPASKMH